MGGAGSAAALNEQRNFEQPATKSEAAVANNAPVKPLQQQSISSLSSINLPLSEAVNDYIAPTIDHNVAVKSLPKSAAGAVAAASELEPIIIESAQDVLSNAEARRRIQYALSFAPPGTKLRWQKLLAVTNRVVNLTDDEIKKRVRPLIMDINMTELRKILNALYDRCADGTREIESMRKYLKQRLYDKHDVTTAKRFSRRERRSRNLLDSCYAYGELDPEELIRIYAKTKAAFGCVERDDACFYDLGCGVGMNVYAGAFWGGFAKCKGIENIDVLLQRGAKRKHRWDAIKDFLPPESRETDFDFVLDDILECDFFTEDATFVLLHWTAFSFSQRQIITKILEKCKEGCLFVTITFPIASSDFTLLQKGTCNTSWMPAANESAVAENKSLTFYFVHEKLTPSAT